MKSDLSECCLNNFRVYRESDLTYTMDVSEQYFTANVLWFFMCRWDVLGKVLVEQ